MRANSLKANLSMELLSILMEAFIGAIWSMERKVAPMVSLNLMMEIVLLEISMKMSLAKEYMKLKMGHAMKELLKMERRKVKGS